MLDVLFLNENSVLKEWLFFAFCPFLFWKLPFRTPPNPTSSLWWRGRAAWRGKREAAAGALGQEPWQDSSCRCAQDGWFAYLHIVASQAGGSLHM